MLELRWLDRQYEDLKDWDTVGPKTARVLQYRRVAKVVRDIKHDHWWSRPTITETAVWSEWADVPVVNQMIEQLKDMLP